MTSQRNISPIVVAGMVAILLIVLIIVLGWSPWLIAVVAAVCCGFGALGYLAFNRVPPQPGYVAPPPLPAPGPVPEPAVQTAAIQGVNLPSAWADYQFIVDATVYWRPVGPATTTHTHLRPSARAIDSIIDRAARIAAGEEPMMAVRLRHRLDDVLGMVETDPTGRVEAWADQVRVSLPDADASRLQTLAGIRKDEALWEHQRRFECDKRKYLADDVLRSTGSALVWWLSRNETDVTRAVELIGTMARLSAAARNEEIPELFRHLVSPELLSADARRFGTVGSDGTAQPFDMGFIGGLRAPVDLLAALMSALRLDDEQWSLFAAQVADDVAAAGNPDAADEIRRRFNVIIDEPAPEPEPARNGAPTWSGDDGDRDADAPAAE